MKHILKDMELDEKTYIPRAILAEISRAKDEGVSAASRVGAGVTREACFGCAPSFGSRAIRATASARQGRASSRMRRVRRFGAELFGCLLMLIGGRPQSVGVKAEVQYVYIIIAAGAKVNPGFSCPLIFLSLLVRERGMWYNHLYDEWI